MSASSRMSAWRRPVARCALAGVVLAVSSCSLFPDKAARSERAYQRYVEQSMRERDKRRALIAEEKRAEANRLAAEAVAAAEER